MRRSLALVLLLMLWTLAPTIVLADSHDPQRIMPAEVMERLNAGEEIIFLDTRTPADWAAASSMIPNAIRARDNAALNKVVRETPKDQLIVTYCT